jgi:hypothetical protein
MKVTISQNLLSFISNAYSDLNHPLKPSHTEIDLIKGHWVLANIVMGDFMETTAEDQVAIFSELRTLKTNLQAFDNHELRSEYTKFDEIDTRRLLDWYRTDRQRKFRTSDTLRTMAKDGRFNKIGSEVIALPEPKIAQN